jgi:hypothetical protein
MAWADYWSRVRLIWLGQSSACRIHGRQAWNNAWTVPPRSVHQCLFRKFSMFQRFHQWYKCFFIVLYAMISGCLPQRHFSNIAGVFVRYCMRWPHMLHVSVYFVTKCSTHFLLRFAKCGFVTYALFATLISEMLHEFIDHGEMVQMMLHMDKKITIWIN